MPCYLIIKRNVTEGPDGPEKHYPREVIEVYNEEQWARCGGEKPVHGKFYVIKLTNKTQDEARHYMQDWKHDPVAEVIQSQGNNRRVRFTSDMVSASGKNALTREHGEGLLAELNQIEGITAAYNDHGNKTLTIDVTVSGGNGTIKAERLVRAQVMAMNYLRNIRHKMRRWYITQAAVDFLDANGGYAEGTAAQVSNYLRDGFLD